jgi:hypothetical protein
LAIAIVILCRPGNLVSNWSRAAASLLGKDGRFEFAEAFDLSADLGQQINLANLL